MSAANVNYAVFIESDGQITISRDGETIVAPLEKFKQLFPEYQEAGVNGSRFYDSASHYLSVSGNQQADIMSAAALDKYIENAARIKEYCRESEPSPGESSFRQVKARKKAEIDANTNRIKERDGLLFEHKRFSMSDSAMLKWTGLMAAKDILQFPIAILTKDDEEFIIADHSELMAFLAAVLAYETDPQSPLSTDRALRSQVEAAQTPEEVNSVADDRR